MVTNYNQQNYGILSENLETQAGINDVLIKNIEACNELKNVICRSYGPSGESRLITGKTNKITITSDSSTILNSLAYVHPASKIILSSVSFQDQELGDSSGFVVILIGELLTQSLKLLNMGFNSYEIIKTLQKFENVCSNVLNTLSNYRLKNIKNLKNLISILLVSVNSKCQKLEKHLIPQIAYACVKIVSAKNQKFSQENIRVVKILGGICSNSKTISGTIILRDSEGLVKIIKRAKIAIFTCSFDILSPETKNNIVFKHPRETLSFESKEKNFMEERVNSFLSSGINVVVASGFSDDAIDSLNSKEILALKVQSKFEIQRIANVTNSTVLPNLRTPTHQEIGYSDQVSVRSFGSQKVTIFYQESLQNKIFTIVARANCNSILDLIERVVYKTSSIFKSISRNNRFIPGAGACEIELSRRLKSFAHNINLLNEKFIFRKFANCFEIFPEILIQNAHLKDSAIISRLINRHKEGLETEGVDLENGSTICTRKSGIWDLFSSKFWAVKNSIDSALTVLSVDQVIVARENYKN